MRDKWDGYIFQSDSDEENNLIEKEKRATEYKKHDMGKVNCRQLGLVSTSLPVWIISG